MSKKFLTHTEKYIVQFPLCEKCYNNERIKDAITVAYRKNYKNKERLNCIKNLISLCEDCAPAGYNNE